MTANSLKYKYFSIRQNVISVRVFMINMCRAVCQGVDIVLTQLSSLQMQIISY